MSWARMTRIWTAAGGLCVGLLSHVSAQTADEVALWRLWTRHQAEPTEHAVHATAFADFADTRPDDPLAPLAGTLAAWHLLQAGRVDEATTWLERYARPSRHPTARGASQLARAWLTRLDRERVVQALDAYRTREVRFPERLTDLNGHAAVQRAGIEPPLEDRWGQSWIYQLEAMRALTRLAGQRYRLESRRLRGDGMSDLNKALAVPYGDGIPLEVVRIMGAGQTASAQLADPAAPDAPIALSPGAQHESIALEYLSDNLVILHDTLHWKIMRTPRGRGP